MQDHFLPSLLSTAMALALVLGLAWLLLRLLRDRLASSPRAGAGSTTVQDDALRFVRALPVGAKERVVIVEHRGQRWMLGVAAGGVSVLAHWPDARSAVTTVPPAPAASPTSGDCGQP